MFNRAAHESSLPCSSAPSQPPCAAAQQSCSRCSFIPSRKQLNYDRTPILAGSVSGRRTLGSRRLRLTCRSEAARPSVRHPVTKEAKAFAPATIANLGPGFDWMGCAVEGEGDTVTATALPDRPGYVEIESIEGDGGRLTLEAPRNCVGIAAIETLKLMGQTSCGVSLKLQKGLPLGSGMGSSAASAAAGAWAVNSLFGNPLSKEELVPAGLASEAIVSGYHADNIAPALLGGFVLIRSCNPLDIQQLSFPGDLWFVLVNPVFEAPTAEMRAVLPKQIAMSSAIHNCAMGGSLVAGILQGCAKTTGRALDSDCIVEPVRGPLIPGFAAVKRAAKAAGAYGCTISGAGPTCVAVTDGKEQGERIAEAMVQAFRESGPLEVNSARVVKLDHAGAKSV